jgi:AcrR family transcriptional regulator
MNGPDHSTTTRDRILNAAEALFAQRGYYGVTIRQITNEAGVDVALSNYYFGPKADLFRAVLERRAAEHHDILLRSIEAAVAAAGGRAPRVETLIRAFAQPVVDKLVRGDEGWRNYIHLMAGLYTSQQMDFLVAMNDLYAPVLRRLIELIGRSVPSASERSITLSFYMLLTALLGIYAETPGLERLSTGTINASDFDAILDHLAPFFAAGFHRMASE